MKPILFFLLIILLNVSFVFAQPIGHITLLAVSEATQIGSTADLYIKTQAGSGGVYIETFPLTKLDTQLSTRFAQQIACDFLEKDCSTIDFFYTIQSDATILGGPSAGAAIAAVTVAMLDNLEINESVAISGTINVGGLIGPVGSLVSKIDAAQKQGMTKVLIPKGSRYEEKPEIIFNELLENTNASFYVINNDTNMTEIDLYDYGDIIGVEVKEVGNLQEAVYEITGQWYTADETEIVPPDWYTETMKGVAVDLCSRNRDFILKYIPTNETNATLYAELINITIRAENASAYEKYYVAASTCFGQNIRMNYLILESANFSKNLTLNKVQEINQTIADVEEQLQQEPLDTITDLQTYLVVNERIEEAKETLKELYINLAIDLYTDTSYELAYASERLYSARAWSTFFDNNDKVLELDDNALRESCIQKRAEAQERFQYIQLIFDQPLQQITDDLDEAESQYSQGNYVLCLEIASRAKANLDIMLSLLGVTSEDQLTMLVEERLKLVRQVINKQQTKGYFPMLGYSYYEYATFLKESDPYSSLIYSHYALEFSHLDMYFKEKSGYSFFLDTENLLYLLLGFGMGILFTISLLWKKLR
ncbi:MAG: S16 family serine protease [Candidatus Woesearchaeota archaeon]